MHLIALCSQGMYHPLNRPPTLLHCYHSCPLLTFCLIAILKENTKDSVKTIIWTYFEWWEGKDESILAGDKKGFLGSPTEKARAWSISLFTPLWRTPITVGREAEPGPRRGLLEHKAIRRTSRWREKGPWGGSESHSVGYSWNGYWTFLHGIWKSVFTVSLRLADDIQIMWVVKYSGGSK